MSMLSCKGLACGYNGVAAVGGIDLEVEEGQIVALLGPNGSGKSAMLKTICKLLPPVAGEVSLQGRSIRDMSHREIAASIGFVPQEEATPFPFLVRDVVTMGRLPRSTGLFDTAEDRRVAEDAMREADCLSLADRPITELSGGEKQRALIARAIAQQAPLLLLDEPTSHLDVAHQVAIIDLLRRLVAAGRAAIMAIHDLNLAATVADSGILLDSGRVAMRAPMSEIVAASELDTAFGVAFERSRTASGATRVFPTR